MEARKIPKWLKRIQENSWEPEILISGGAIFILFDLSDWFYTWYWDFLHFSNIQMAGASVLVITLLTAIEGLKLMFLIHLIMRGFWTGMVSLSYVFPNQVTAEKFGFKGKFIDLVNKEAHIDDFIIRLEKVCSLTFAFSLRTVLAVLGFAILLLSIFIPLNYLKGFEFLTWIYLGLMLLYFLDTITFGYFRKSEKLAKWYFPVYQLFSYITLSFLYRRLITALLGNLPPKKMAPLGFAVIVISFSMALKKHQLGAFSELHFNGSLYENYQSNDVFIPARYLNYWQENDKKPEVQIERDVVADYSTLLVFIQYNADMDEAFGGVVTPENFKSNFSINIGDTLISCDFMTLGINPKTKRRGLIGHLNLNWLSAGKHHLNVMSKLALYQNRNAIKTESGYLFSSIPFWRE